MNLFKTLLGKATKVAAETQACKELGKIFTQVEFQYGEDVNGKKWVKAYHDKKGYSDKYYYG